MARIRTDSDRAALLNSLLDQQAAPDDYDNVPPGPMNNRMPIAGTRGGEQQRIINKMDSRIDPQTDADYEDMYGPEDQYQPMPERTPDRGMPTAPGMDQADMVMVPRKMAQTAMQMLMQQGSANSIGKANGADGQMASLPDNAEVPGEEPTTDDEVEAAEEYQRNKGKKTLNNMRS